MARRRRKADIPAKRPPRNVDPVSAYAWDVCSGKIISCRFVRLACERHFHDLASGERRGLTFSPQWAQRAIRFFAHYLRHSKGEWAGKPVALEPWQEFAIGSVYGWFRRDGTRRFRTAYEEVARKNGKSTQSAGVGIYALVADHEPGAEVYAAAPLALDTAIPTASGWKAMGQIEVGDRLFDENGDLTTVTYVSPVLLDRECWEIVLSNGEAITCDIDHRWLADSVWLRPGGVRGDRNSRRHKVWTTREIVGSLLTPRDRPNFRVKIGRSLGYPGCGLPIPPYTLGVWLGDGRANRGAIVGTVEDSSHIASEVEGEGFTLSNHTTDSADGLRHYTVLGLRTKLRHCGLLENKHIPPEYLIARHEDRLALLQGLMDTDATCTKTGECRFTNRSYKLARGVEELARSLGARATVRVINVEGAPHYVVSFKPTPTEIPAFRLPRKLKRQVHRSAETTRWLQIESATPVESVPVRCISVDSPSHLYLATRSLIATHNTKKDQARIIFNEAQRMVRASPDLRRKVGVFKFNLSIDNTASKFEPLSSDERTLDGLNPHCVLVDELHKHRTRAVLDVLDTAIGARRQPILWIITTAGDDNPESVYASENAYAIQVLEGTVRDDSYFALIYTLDRDDRWDDPKVWIKANPNLHVSVKNDDLKRQALKAAHSPPALIAFKRLRLNLRTSDITRAIDMDVWRRNTDGPFDPAMLHGRKFFGALDLSSKIDLSAWIKLYPPTEDETRWRVVSRFWMPADTVAEKSDRDQVQYRRWIDDGLIEVTAGNVVDHNEIGSAVLEDSRLSEPQAIAYDPWNAAQLASSLSGEGLPVVEFIQGIRSYTAPSKELEAMLLADRIDHGGNEVLAWMASNLHVRTDPNENRMPSKKHSIGRIDGMTALIMAIGLAMLDQPSIYEQRGLSTF